MDDVLCEYTKEHRMKLLNNPEIEFPQGVEGFFKGLEPIKNAVKSLEELNDCGRFDVYILTAPSIHNPHCYTEKRLWVENHLGFKMVDRLIISNHKGLSKGHYLIDDHIEGRGQENFEGKLLHFGSSNFPDWKSINSYFKSKYDF